MPRDDGFLYHVETYGELHPHLDREWLLTDGRGGFAMGTVVGCNTRRYHALLCAAAGNSPVGRVVTLARVGESLEMLDGNPDKPAYDLSVCQFGDQIEPRGERYLCRFSLGDTARWDYDVADVHVEKEVQLVHGGAGVLVRYRVNPSLRGRVRLTLRPFVALRGFHDLRQAGGVEPRVEDHGGWQDGTHAGHARVVDGSLGVSLRAVADHDLRRVAEGDWWFGHTYPIEAERGLPAQEDLFAPGRYVVELDKPGEVVISAWVGEREPPEWDAVSWERLRRRDQQRPMPTPTQRRLSRAAGDFVVRRRSAHLGGGDTTTVLAGYPWFADWGRDAMIALPGLLLTTGRHAEAGQVLALFASHVRGGLIPNRFDDHTGEPSYNTLDAALWFVRACHLYRDATNERDTFDAYLRPACEAVLDGYRAGTEVDGHRIGVDSADGLVFGGGEGSQLTWMDAQHEGVVFTPRHGKPVEVNALWHEALVLMGETAEADRVAEGFRSAFWLAPHKGLADVVRGGPGSYEVDESVRPNQIIAAALPGSPLDRDQRAAVVERVRKRLLTPVGLRTLSAQDDGYEPEYRGDFGRRDRAYHNGTVHAWLIGPFLDAYLAAHGRDADTLEQARSWLRPLVAHLDDACLGQVSECFDASAPHRPVASPAQAVSVAELLRLSVELEL